MSNEETKSKAEIKLIDKFKEGVRRLWGSEAIEGLHAELNKRNAKNIPMCLGMHPGSVSRGRSLGECSLESLIIALNNSNTPWSQLPNFRSPREQCLAGWWLAYLELKLLKSQKSGLQNAATKCFTEDGRTNLDCPLRVCEGEEITLPEFILLNLLCKRSTEWSTTPANRHKLAKEIWSEYSNFIGFTSSTMPDGFLDRLNGLREEKLADLIKFQQTPLFRNVEDMYGEKTKKLTNAATAQSKGQ